MSNQNREFVIQGVNTRGEAFRPSDWAERLAGVMSSFGGGRLGYSPYCFPITSGRIKCVVVDARLKEIEPMAYNFLVNFARDNELQVRPGRDAERPEAGDVAAQKRPP
ncbi:MAG: DUF3579 domain-containing protein [Burkholderiales bacterium]|nr:DUF3579 domain-containing protein [Burkholderiales bacterium]